MNTPVSVTPFSPAASPRAALFLKLFPRHFTTDSSRLAGASESLRLFARVSLTVLFAGMWGHAAHGAEAARLVGTVPLNSIQNEPTHAVFETADHRQMIIDIGQEIDGCRLASVHAHHVVMDCADGSVLLTLPCGMKTRTATGSPLAAVYHVTLPRDAFNPGQGQRPVGQLSLEPAVRDGWLYGYRVAWVEPGGEFHRLGLRPDDVVVRLNDVPAGTAGAFMQAVGELPALSGFQLTVERSGELIDYQYLFD